MMIKRGYTAWGVVLLFCFCQCMPAEQVHQDDDKLLAEVYNKKLYLSELEGMIPANNTPEDSLLLMNAIIERWVRESLIMHEAEKNIPQDLDIDQLVKDYRASLVQHNYEKLLVNIQMDSVVNAVQMKAYYDKHKEQFVLKNDIARCYFIKVSKDNEELGDLENWMKTDDNREAFLKMASFCDQHANFFYLNDSMWYEQIQIVELCPKGKFSTSNFKENTYHKLEDENYLYLIKIFETMSSKKIAPMAFVEDNISKVILNERKMKLLEDKKEELYERETRKNNVKIFN